MGLFDGNDYGGNAMPSVDPRILMLASLAGAAGQSAMPSRLPVPNGAALGNIASAIGPGYLQGFQAQQAGIQNQLLQQRFKMMQDALGGSGMFGGSQDPGQSQGMPQAQAAQTALSGGGGPSVANAATMNGLLSSGTPQGGAQGLLGGAGPAQPQQPGGAFAPGLSTDLYRKALISEELIPGSGKTLLEKNMPGYQAFRGGGYLLKPDGSLTQLPNVPQGMTVKQNQDGSFEAVQVPGALGGAAALENVKQRARVEAEEAIQGNKYALETGEPPPTGAGGIPGVPSLPPLASAQPQSRGAVGSGNPAPSSAQAVITDRGTTVPLPTKQNQTMGPGSDLITKQNAASVETENKWNSVRPTVETARNRLMTTAQAFQTLEGKGLNEGKAEVSNMLRGAGLGPIADMVMSAKDTASVQKVLWNSMQEALSTLKTINAGTGGRILNSEFQAFMEHGFSPNMLGDALHSAISQQLGTIYQTTNMIDDYFGEAKPRGWRDANQFQSAYLRKNPVENFVDYAAKDIGPLKGMTEAPGSARLQTPPSDADIAHTAQKYGISPAEVKRRLGIQ